MNAAARLRAAARLCARDVIYRCGLPVSYRLRMIAARPGVIRNMLLVAPDRSYLYVPIFKVANTTVRQALWRLAGVDLPDEEMGTAYRETGPFTDVRQLNGRELKAVFTGRSTFRFTFVRNPYARLLSAYRDKIAGRPWDVRNYLEGLGWAEDATPTFDAFVRRVTAQPDLLKDAHWLPQHRCAFFDFVRYDFIGRFESFEADFKTVMTKIGDGRPVAIGRLNPSADDHLAYTDELAELVYKAYRRDFELFGYSPESYRRPF